MPIHRFAKDKIDSDFARMKINGGAGRVARYVKILSFTQTRGATSS